MHKKYEELYFEKEILKSESIYFFLQIKLTLEKRSYDSS